MSNENKETIKAEMPDRTYEFENWSEVAKWAAEEHKLWNTLATREEVTSPPVFTNGGLQKVRPTMQQWQSLRAAADQAVSNKNQAVNASSKFTEIIGMVARSAILYSRKSPGTDILALANDDPRAAYAWMALTNGGNIEPSDIKDLGPTIRALHHAGVSPFPMNQEIQARAEALEQLVIDWDTKYRSYAEAEENEFTAVLSDLNEKLNNVGKKIEDAEHRAKNSQTNIRRLHRLRIEKLNALEKTYADKLKLKATAKYWSDKADDHRNAYRLFNGSFLGGLIITAASILVTLICVGSNMWTATFNLLGLTDTANKSDFDALAIMLPVLFFVVWGLRYMNKAAQREILLSNDAQQRSVMAQTFLALEVDTRAQVGDSERVLAMQALFRPIIGLEKEEATPPDLVALIRGNKTDIG